MAGTDCEGRARPICPGVTEFVSDTLTYRF